MKIIYRRIHVYLLSLTSMLVAACSEVGNMAISEKMDYIEKLEKEVMEGESSDPLDKLFALALSESEDDLVRQRSVYVIGKTVIVRHEKGMLDSSTLDRVLQLQEYDVLTAPLFWLYSQIPNISDSVVNDAIEVLFAVQEHDGNKSSLVSSLIKLILETELLSETKKLDVIGRYLTTIAIPGSERYADRGLIYFQVKKSLSEVDGPTLEAMRDDLNSTNSNIKILATAAYRHFGFSD